MFSTGKGETEKQRPKKDSTKGAKGDAFLGISAFQGQRGRDRERSEAGRGVRSVGGLEEEGGGRIPELMDFAAHLQGGGGLFPGTGGAPNGDAVRGLWPYGHPPAGGRSPRPTPRSRTRELRHSDSPSPAAWASVEGTGFLPLCPRGSERRAAQAVASRARPAPPRWVSVPAARPGVLPLDGPGREPRGRLGSAVPRLAEPRGVGGAN